MKTLKSLTLFTALVILSACSASGNDSKNNGGSGGGNGDGGGTQTIFDKLIGTWEGVDPNPNTYVFTKTGVSYDTVHEVPVKEITLKDGKRWALYYNDKEPSFPYMIYYTDGKNLTWMSAASEADVIGTPKDELDHLTQAIQAIKKT